MRIVAAVTYERQVRRLLSPAERARAEADVASRPDAWPVIPGAGGARKARVAMGGRGKRGGGRLIYFHMPTPGVVVLLLIYAKAKKEDLTHDEKHEVRLAVAEAKEAFQPG